MATPEASEPIPRDPAPSASPAPSTSPTPTDDTTNSSSSPAPIPTVTSKTDPRTRPHRLVYPNQSNFFAQPKGGAIPEPTYLWDPFPTEIPDVGILGHYHTGKGGLGTWKIPTICAAVLAFVLGLALLMLAAWFVGKRMLQHRRERRETREFYRMPEHS